MAFNPFLGMTQGVGQRLDRYGRPISGNMLVGQLNQLPSTAFQGGTRVPATAPRGQAPLTQQMNNGLVPFVDPYQARPMYGQRDPVTGQYELLGWNTLAGGQRELPQKHWLSEDYANRFRNPFRTSEDNQNPLGLVAPGFLEENPRSAWGLLAKYATGVPNAQRWLGSQYDRFRNLYEGEVAINPSLTWLNFLGNLDLGQEYQNASRFERGERPGSLVPFARRLGY